jgi:hypothetical protein
MESREERVIAEQKKIIALYSKGIISLEEAQKRVWELIWCTPGYLLVP